MPPDIDPNADVLGLILTAGGAVVAATIIASLIQVVKRVPTLGKWIDANREPGIVLVLSLLVVGFAYVTTTKTFDAFNGFAAFLAWLGVAGIATKSYEIAPQGVKDALGGTGKG